MNCPYCGHQMNEPIITPPLSMRQKSIYQAVVSAGSSGIETSRLIAAMYGKQTPTMSGYGVMRVQVHEINKKLTSINQRIQGYRHCGYRLVAADAPQD